MKGSIALGLSSILFSTTQAFAGAFIGPVHCFPPEENLPCAPLSPTSNNSVIINEFGIVHPQTYQLSGGLALPNVRVCVEDAFDGNLSRAVEWAVGKWNALKPAVNNCLNCEITEIGGNAGDANLASTVLHEFGHCGFALQHQGLVIDADLPPGREETSYTISYGGAANFIDEWLDNVRGSKDDRQPAGGGGIATTVFWFPSLTNDPINLHFKPIDSTSYAQGFLAFPPGSTFAANANHEVARLMGEPETQSVMWSRSDLAVFFDLAPDDVHMVLLARTGDDRLLQDPPPPAPGDDYAIELEIVPCNEAHEITVLAADVVLGGRGKCSVGVDFSDPGEPNPAGADNFKLSSGVITINTLVDFEFRLPVFYGSFEGGDFDPEWILSP